MANDTSMILGNITINYNIVLDKGIIALKKK